MFTIFNHLSVLFQKSKKPRSHLNATPILFVKLWVKVDKLYGQSVEREKHSFTPLYLRLPNLLYSDTILLHRCLVFIFNQH